MTEWDTAVELMASGGGEGGGSSASMSTSRFFPIISVFLDPRTANDQSPSKGM